MRALIIIMLFCSTQAFASDDSDASDNFDSDTGLYFHAISKALPKKSCFSCDADGNEVNANLFIYDPAKKTGRNLFLKSPGVIDNFIVESEYNAKERKMLFIGDSHIKNNKNIRARKPNKQFLVESYTCSDDNHCLYTVWKAEKMGGEPKVLFKYADEKINEWHLDVKNSVVRLLTKKGTSFSVEEFPW